MYDRSVTKYFTGWREKSSGYIVLHGNHLCESVVNKPLSFLSSDHPCHT